MCPGLRTTSLFGVEELLAILLPYVELPLAITRLSFGQCPVRLISTLARICGLRPYFTLASLFLGGNVLMTLRVGIVRTRLPSCCLYLVGLAIFPMRAEEQQPTFKYRIGR